MSIKGRILGWGVMVAVGCAAFGCRTKVEVEPVEVKPIKMTIDVNIKVDRRLDEFFEFEEQIEPDREDDEEEDEGGER